MYVNVATGRGFKGLVAYQLEAEREQENHVLGGNVPASDPKLCARQFIEVAEQKSSVRKPVLHMIVSWHPNDQPTDEQMGQVGERLLDAMGFDRENHQYLMVRHTDKPHPHMHVVGNRVGYDGRVFADKNFPGRKAHQEAQRIERDYGFTPAIPTELREGGQLPELRSMGLEDRLEGRQERPLQAMEDRLGVKSAKRLVHEAVRRAILKSDGTFEALDSALRKDGVATPSWSFNSQGEFNGASFTLMSSTRPGEAEIGPHGGTFTFKGSQLGPKPGLAKGAILAALDSRAKTVQRQRFASSRDIYRTAQALRAIRQATQERMTLGSHLGRRLRRRASYLTPLRSGMVGSILRLFDNRRVGNLQRGIRPSHGPSIRRR